MTNAQPTPIAEVTQDRLAWHMPDNLRWLSEQDHRPDYLPCGMLTGYFLKECAQRWEGKIDALADAERKLEEAVTQLKRARRIIADIDDYMARPDRGDWGAECALCMGELLDDDRATLIAIDAFLAQDGGKAG